MPYRVTERAMGALFVIVAVAGGIAACGGNHGAGSGGAGGTSTDSTTTTGSGDSGVGVDISVCMGKGGNACHTCCRMATGQPLESFREECLECMACQNVCACGGSNQSSACYTCEDDAAQAGACKTEAEQKCAGSSLCMLEQQCLAQCPPDCRNCYDLVNDPNGTLPACQGSQALFDAYHTCVCVMSAFPASPSDPAGCSDYCGGSVCPFGSSDCTSCIYQNCGDQYKACYNDPG